MKIEPFEYENRTSKLDMVLTAVEEKHAITLNIKYSTNLFKKESIQRFTVYFKDIVTSILKNSHVKLKDIDIYLDFTESTSTVSNEAQGAFDF